MRIPYVLQEFLAAGAATACLGALVAFVYWLITGWSPWPGLILAEVAGFGWGAAILALTSPRRYD